MPVAYRVFVLDIHTLWRDLVRGQKKVRCKIHTKYRKRQGAVSNRVTIPEAVILKSPLEAMGVTPRGDSDRMLLIKPGKSAKRGLTQRFWEERVICRE